MIQQAIRFAIQAHKNQFRKGTNHPYIEHPMYVGLLLAQAGAKETVIVAGLLHDTLEDTFTREQDILDGFGEEVLNLVKAVSEPDKSLPWMERKRISLENLNLANNDILLITLCDKYANLLSIESEMEICGERLWDRFNAGYEEQKWYYQSICKALQPLIGNRLFQEFADAVDRVYGKKN